MYLIPAILFSGCIVFNVSLFLEKRMGYSNKISKKNSFTIFLAYVVVIFYTAFLSREPGSRMIIPGLSEPPVRTLRATIPENGSHILR